ncbi:MAG: alkaline phosphatase family protein [Fimbriimonadaceae bacterium]|nr:alkaline phosphatase family protein [Fimbriimonadaceae bacterium]
MLASAVLATLLRHGTPAASTVDIYAAPADQEFAQVVPGGRTILPNGRLLTPIGKRLWTGDDTWQVALSPNGRWSVGVRTGGFNGTIKSPGLTIYDTTSPDTAPRVLEFKQVAPALAFTPDGNALLVSEGDAAAVSIVDTNSWQVKRRIVTGKGGYINDLIVSRDGTMAYGVDVATQELVTLNLGTGEVASRVRAGRQPYALAFNAAETKIFVANIGIFDYTVVPKATPGVGHPSGLQKPPFGYPSRQATDGVMAEGRRIAGLGSPFVPDSQSVWAYGLADRATPRMLGSAKSGVLIHAPADSGKAVGGSAPNALLVHRDTLYVSNANNDTLSVFHAPTLRLIRTIKLYPGPAWTKLRGSIPSGMAISRDGARLYVCLSGLNAVAAIDTQTARVVGHIPTGWFPMQVRLAPNDRTLHIACQKGLGRGPRGPKNPRPDTDERFGMVEMPGFIQQVDIPDDATLARLTTTVLANNGLVKRPVPVTQRVLPLTPGKASEQIKYVVFITKENHTFDGIFGGLKGAKGEPDYAEFGMNGWIQEKGKAERLPIMPNHIRLAEQFAISDNFYMEPQASGDGHRWLVGVYPSLWTTRVFYAGWDFRADDKTKGRLVSFGSDGSQIPEDYLENGSIWEHLNRNRITFRNYGEGYELPNSLELEANSKTGTNYVVNHPMPKVLYDNTCFDFPAYNNAIPDIARADWFIEDIERNFRAKKKPLPRFLNIAICNDHGASPNAKRGFPYVCSYMADNDLALGRIVEYLSRQPEWKNMAIFVTQDDSGGDNDHIDRHRSFVQLISPYAKRGYVSRDHTSIMSIIRSIYLLYGLGPNNMFDAVATPLHDMFTDKPDFTPYRHVPVDPRVFKPEDTFDPSDPQFKRRRGEKGVKMDDPAFVEWLRQRGG